MRIELGSRIEYYLGDIDEVFEKGWIYDPLNGVDLFRQRNLNRILFGFISKTQVNEMMSITNPYFYVIANSKILELECTI